MFEVGVDWKKCIEDLYDPREFEDCVIPDGQKLAIIIPFRENGSNVRTNQLKVLLHYVIPILIRQNVMFQFFVVTQVKKTVTHLIKE